MFLVLAEVLLLLLVVVVSLTTVDLVGALCRFLYLPVSYLSGSLALCLPPPLPPLSSFFALVVLSFGRL